MTYNYGYPGYYSGYGTNNYGGASAATPAQTQQTTQQFNGYAQNPYPTAAPVQSSLDMFPSFFVDTYEQVRQTSVAADGTPSIFISNNEDRFWLKKTNTENGRTIVKTFVFKEDTDEQNNAKNSTILGKQENKEYNPQEIDEKIASVASPLLQEINILKDTVEKLKEIIYSNENNNLKEESMKVEKNKVPLIKGE